MKFRGIAHHNQQHERRQYFYHRQFPLMPNYVVNSGFLNLQEEFEKLDQGVDEAGEKIRIEVRDS